MQNNPARCRKVARPYRMTRKNRLKIFEKTFFQTVDIRPKYAIITTVFLKEKLQNSPRFCRAAIAVSSRKTHPFCTAKHCFCNNIEINLKRRFSFWQAATAKKKRLFFVFLRQNILFRHQAETASKTAVKQL